MEFYKNHANELFATLIKNYFFASVFKDVLHCVNSLLFSKYSAICIATTFWNTFKNEKGWM